MIKVVALGHRDDRGAREERRETLTVVASFKLRLNHTRDVNDDIAVLQNFNDEG